MEKIELLCPVGSMGMLKAAVASGADSVYLGMKRFGARDYATNFNKDYLRDAVRICKSNNVKLYLTMNTLVKNSEIKEFFNQMRYAYESGIDSVIIQDPSFIGIIREGFPGLRVHISTQAGVMNSSHANLFLEADRINLARELDKKNIESIRKNFNKEIEVFVHGALCACVSGSCLFSSLLGGRSGNRGKCAQPCRKRYGSSFPLSTKELCLIEKLPDIIQMGINSLKIEGRMRTPFYVATATSIYRQAIDSYYAGRFDVTQEMKNRLNDAFSRGFTEGKFSGEHAFNPNQGTGTSNVREVMYEVKTKSVKLEKREAKMKELRVMEKPSSGKQMIVRVYDEWDVKTANHCADIIAIDMFQEDYEKIKGKSRRPVYAVTPRIMMDSDIEKVRNRIKELAPEGLIAGNLGILGMGFKIPVILDYNSNCFNDIQLGYYQRLGAKPIMSPELSITELEGFKNKDFAVFAHGRIRLMTLAHDIPEAKITGDREHSFRIKKTYNGVEVINDKDLGLLNKMRSLVKSGINQLYLDPEPGRNYEAIMWTYRNLLDGKMMDVSGLQGKSTEAWSGRGVQ